MLSDFWYFLVQTDEFLLEFARAYPVRIYFIIFFVIFFESSNLLFSFLPGDGFLLAIGIITATGLLNIWLVLSICLLAAILGYFVNYYTGKVTGRYLLHRTGWIKQKHLDRTNAFFEQHGDKALIIGRFFPVIRTFAPFLAGMTSMNYTKFVKDTIIGAVIWILLFVGLGFILGEVSFIQENFFLIYLGLILISLIPLIWKLKSFFVRSKNSSNG
jgi:membrane-associated protein